MTSRDTILVKGWSGPWSGKSGRVPLTVQQCDYLSNGAPPLCTRFDRACRVVLSLLDHRILAPDDRSRMPFAFAPRIVIIVISQWSSFLKAALIHSKSRASGEARSLFPFFCRSCEIARYLERSLDAYRDEYVTLSRARTWLTSGIYYLETFTAEKTLSFHAASRMSVLHDCSRIVDSNHSVSALK